MTKTFLALLCCATLSAQTKFADSPLYPAVTAPGTPATGFSRCYIDSTSKLWTCKDDAGVVTTGSGTPGGSSGNIQYNLTGAFAGAAGLTTPDGLTFTVPSGGTFTYSGTGIIDARKILGTTITGLSGPIKMTLGIPSVAASSDIIGLWSGTCSGGVNFLRGDGVCAAPAGTPFVYTGVLSGIPATCTVGTIAFITNATAGQNIYECQSTNVWTQQLNSGGGGSTPPYTLCASGCNTTIPASGSTILASAHGFGVNAGGRYYDSSNVRVPVSETRNSSGDLTLVYSGTLGRIIIEVGGFGAAGTGTVTSSGTPLIHQISVWTTSTDAKGIAVGGNNTVLRGSAAADPAFGSLVAADLPATLTSGTAITNAALTTPTITVKDASLTIQDDVDTTKQMRFMAGSITTGTTRQYTLPDVNDTLVTLGATQTLTSKTLTTPTISATGFTNANHAHAAANSGGTLDASAIAAGTVATARLGSGTANSTTFLRGDQTYATPAGGGGTVTNIATTSPITGGPITNTGTIACATCVTSAAALTSTALVTGAGSQGSQTPATTATMDSSGNISTPGSITSGAGGSVGGYSAYGQGTATTAPTSSVGWMASASVTTPFFMKLPAAPVTGFVYNTGTTDPSTISFQSPTAATALLDACSATVKGLVPTPPNNTTTFLRGDCTFATPAGAGTVTSSGTPLIHQMSVWTTSTDAKGIAVGANNTVLRGSTGADPAFGSLVAADIPATLSSGTAITNAALTTPRVTVINDANGNPFFTSSATASAVDGVTVTNAATANPATVTVAASGSDANVNLALAGKGTGTVSLNGVLISGTAAAGKVLTSSSASAADWQTPSGGGSGCTVIGNAGDYFIPGAPGPGAYQAYGNDNVVSPSLSTANTTILMRVFISCAWTPDRLAIDITTAGTTGCNAEFGIYDDSKTLIIHSGVMTTSTTFDCDTTGVKVFSASTSPAATGLGTARAAGFYWISSTSNEATMAIRALWMPLAGNALLNAVGANVGFLAGAQVTSGGALNSSFTTGSGWTAGSVGSVPAMIFAKN